MFAENEIFSSETLKAFKVAEGLKSKYDSVIWFSHIDKKTFYYVIKGEWDIYQNLSDDSYGEKKSYKMGLLNSELKEIIPAEFDIIHNIGGTFDELIEVEKQGKKGFYNTLGQNIVPVINDMIIPVNDERHLAVLNIGNDYFWLERDLTISDKDSTIKIADILKKVDAPGIAYTFTEKTCKNPIEYNSRDVHSALYLPSSYLVDWKIVDPFEHFKNPFRKKVEYYDISSSIHIKYDKHIEQNSWLETLIYSIRDNYLGGRSDFYDSTDLLLVDKKSNKVYGYRLPGDEFTEEYPCKETKLKALSDTLFEVKNTSSIFLELASGGSLDYIPCYYYLRIENSKIKALPNKRIFGFTKYIKCDDSYLQGCLSYNSKQLSKLPAEALIYMKMEIYADYNYEFPDSKWIKIFEVRMEGYKPENSSVENKLTETDKYNIAWIDQKLKAVDNKKLAYLK